jgi:hypothetical protein
VAKGNRGLPASWSLDVPSEVVDGPVQLGDYLDEDITRPVAPSSQPVTSPQSDQRIVNFPRTSEEVPNPYSHLNTERVPRPFTSPQHFKQVRAVQRKQLNMAPETLRMVEELLDRIQRYSGQRDAKASELFHGLVSALYEARELIDLQDIPSRGRWGTPTARAFPVALKNAFQRAIAEWCRTRSLRKSSGRCKNSRPRRIYCSAPFRRIPLEPGDLSASYRHGQIFT